jgi:hypothetical protein
MHTLNVNSPIKVSKLKHQISTMVICGSYTFESSVSKDMKKLQVQRNPCFTKREVTIRKVAAHLCLTLVVKEVKMSGDDIKYK